MSQTCSPVPQRRGWKHHLSMLTALLFAALLICSLFWGVNRARQRSIGSSVNGFHAPQASGGPSSLFSIHMIDAMIGWALSAQGVLRTIDGGSQWHVVSPPPLALTHNSIAQFFSSSLAWVALPADHGTPTQVMHTADAGQSWQHTTIQATFPRQISFIDAQHGWLLASWRQPGGAAEPVGVFRTADGGKTWTDVATALFGDTTPPGHLPYGGQKSGIHFLNASRGWVTGTASMPNLPWLYMTDDGGLTWKQQSLPMPPEIPSAQLVLLSHTFFSATAGILPVLFLEAASEKVIATALYVTTDSGSTWHPTSLFTGTTTLLDFVDMQHGWATDGTILSCTRDGGKHWIQLSPTDPFQHIVQLDFVSDHVGWALRSTPATLLTTLDSGHTWSAIFSPGSSQR